MNSLLRANIFDAANINDLGLLLTDAEAQTASVREIELMERAFYRAAQFEWMFWDSAYRLEKWQIG